MFEFSSLLGPKLPQSSANFFQEVENCIRLHSSYLQNVEKWRNLEISYISKLAQLQADAADRNAQSQTESDTVLIRVYETLLNNHKILVNKLNNDVIITNFEECQKMLGEFRNMLESERSFHKDIMVKKEAMEKVQGKKVKLRKNMEEEMMLHIFSEDSCDISMGKKVKRFNRLKEISKQQNQYELKVRQTKEGFDFIISKSKQNLKRFQLIVDQISAHRTDIARKLQLHVSAFANNLSHDMEELNQKEQSVEQNITNFSNKFIESQEEFILKISQQNQGYLQTSLKIINDKVLDEIIEYSKDKEIKKKIKKVIESTNVNFEDTDELTRQVQLVKKIMKNKDCSSMKQFKNIIVKNCKFRMNFVFILQLYRLNSRFEIPMQQVKPMVLLINQLLKTCHEFKDAFVLKQLMVLMLTYYVIYKEEEQEEMKIYIVHFFKDLEMWKDMQLWQSILIECIYLEKKATIRMLLVTSSTSNRNELAEAEKTAVLNQILYIVRNMLLFDFSEKEVKEFTNKFVKLLKQDDRFLKDVHKSIDNALKEESGNKPPPIIKELIQSWANIDSLNQGEN